MHTLFQCVFIHLLAIIIITKENTNLKCLFFLHLFNLSISTNETKPKNKISFCCIFLNYKLKKDLKSKRSLIFAINSLTKQATKTKKDENNYVNRE